jgi:hypothetical protein
MRVPVPTACALIAIGAVALLAGCSGGAPRLSPATEFPLAGTRLPAAPELMPAPSVLLSRRMPVVSRHAQYPSWRSDDAVAPEIYVVDLDSNAVKIYSALGSHGLKGTITGLAAPQGIGVDSLGNLYVANTSAQNVLVYKPGATSPFLTLDDAGNFPVAVAVTLTGVVIVANICSGGGSQCTGNGSIYGYKKGATKHSTTYGTSNILSPYFVTTDAQNHVYADGLSTVVSGVPIVCEYMSGHSTCTDLGIGLNFPGGIQIDKTGDLALDDQAGSGGSTISVYAPGSTVAESSILLCKNISPTKPCDVIGFALTSGDKALWDAYYASDVHPVVIAKETQEFKYPNGGSSVSTIDVGGAVGAVAYAPRSKP